VAKAEGLTPQQEQAVQAMLTEPTLRAVCEAVGTTYPTLRAWMQLPRFQREYRAARREVLEHTIARLQRGLTMAIETLERNMAAGNPVVEIRAAVAMGELATRAVQQMDFETGFRTREAAHEQELARERAEEEREARDREYDEQWKREFLAAP
jgi:hypothetical protein